ncbi:hypothetical protein CMK11_19930 [Candidatus Poribacteria bacterium]|nr:hypothetical protein [Candidatus Poribacteria bacterium]
MHLSADASRIKSLLEGRDPTPQLTPSEQWRPDLTTHLAAATDDDMLAAPPRDPAMARAVRSGLLLWNDALDLAHGLAMSESANDELARRTLDYWHGIMHRREPDYPNSKYWFRRVDRHPVFPAVLAAAKAEAEEAPDDEAGRVILTADEWDPFAFIDLCERHETTAGRTDALLRAVQVAEIVALLEFSVHEAAGAAAER